MDISNQLKKANEALLRNELKKTILILHDCVNYLIQKQFEIDRMRNYRNLISHTSSRLSNLKQKMLMGTISESSQTETSNQISWTLIVIVNEIKESIESNFNQNHLLVNRSKIGTDTKSIRDIELFITENLENYSKSDLEALLKAINKSLNLEHNEGIAGRIVEGDDKIVISVPNYKFKKLENLINEGKLTHLDIKKTRFAQIKMYTNELLSEVQILEDILGEYNDFSDQELELYILSYLKKRLEFVSPRGYFNIKIFEYFKCADSPNSSGIQITKLEEELFYRKLPFAFEIVAAIIDANGRIMKEKIYYTRKSHDITVQTLISTNVLRELLFLYLQKEIRSLVNEENFNAINEYFSRILTRANLGKRIGFEYNRYKNWKEGVLFNSMPKAGVFSDFFKSSIVQFIDKVESDISNKNSFVKAYFYKNYLAYASFYELMATMTATLLEYQSIEVKRITEFSILYGLGIQIINEYADFAFIPYQKQSNTIKTNGTIPADTFSDLYNSNITLPLIYHLDKRSKRKIEAYLEGGAKRKRILRSYPKQILSEIIESEGIYKSIKLSRELATAAKTHLNENNPITPYLKDMCQVAMNNKFYRIFTDTEKENQ